MAAAVADTTPADHMSRPAPQSPPLLWLLVGGVVTLWVAVAVQVAAEVIAR